MKWGLFAVLVGWGLVGFSPRAHAQSPVTEVEDSGGNRLMTVFDNGELEVTGGFLLPDGTLLDESGDLGGLSLPFSSTASSSSDLLTLTQTGSGQVGVFDVDNSSNAAPALTARTNGDGIALFARQNGTDHAGYFQTINSNNSADALVGETNGSGTAVYGDQNGAGRAGLFRISNEVNDSDALEGWTNGSGRAVDGRQTGTGEAGHFEIFNSNNNAAALWAETNGGGNAIRGVQTGFDGAGYLEIDNTNNSDPALQAISNGTGDVIQALSRGSGGRAATFTINSATNSRPALFASTPGSGSAISGLNSGSGFAGSFSASQSQSASDPSGHAVLVNNTGGTNADGLAIQSGPDVDPGNAVNFITFYDGDGTPIGAIEGNGSGGITQTSGSGDFAEELPVREGHPRPEPTDLVGVRGGQVSLATDGADRLLIVSDRPAVTGNATPAVSADDNRRVPVAFIGQVPVKLRGTADVGDWIVASGRADGTARAVAPETYRREKHGPIAGQAWSPKSEMGVGTVTVAVGLDQSGALAERLQEQQAQIDTLRKRLQRVETLQERVAQLEAATRSPSALAGVPGSGLLLAALAGAVAGAVLWRRRRE